MNGAYVTYVVNAVITAAAGAVVFMIWLANRKRLARETVGRAQELADRLAKDAERDADTKKKEALLEAKERAHELLVDAERQARERRQQLSAIEQTLTRRDEKLTERLSAIEQRDKEMRAQEQALGKREKGTADAAAKYERLVADQQRELQRVAGMTADEARESLIKQMEADARRDAANLVKRLDAEARETAAQRARQLITEAIQRSAAEHTTETTVSVVDLPSDDLKGRIIGREGRNIRALEIATGVDLIVDDTPGAIILSGFDPYRREIAKLAIERLIADGRIHPARIEEVVEKVRTELEEEVLKVGENTMLEVGLHGAHKEILRLVGKMKYRSSYGQNMLQHSIEVAFLTGALAAELHLDSTLAKRAGLLHDVGKCVDKSIEGPHALLGFEIARKYGEHPIVANAIGSHHEDIPMESPIAALVQAADAISGARPGARRESVEGYVKRLEKLEEHAQSFRGVSKTYAIQAGREVRVVVEQDRVDDVHADQLAHDISQNIQREMEYPGQIKVTVIREYRSVAYAK
jgi:ribonuclease Y